MTRVRVMPLMLAAAGGAALLPGFLAVAPNRLSGGVPVPAFACAPVWGAIMFASLMLVAASAWRRFSAFGVYAGAGLIWLVVLAAGAASMALAPRAGHAARIELAAGFWLVLATAALATLDAVAVLQWKPGRRAAFGVAVCAGLAAIGFMGRLNALSLAQEFASHRTAFQAAALRHILLVAITLSGALALGVPLGVAAWRNAAWRPYVFSVLNIVQTLPSIALFGLLITPLSMLGFSGIGLLPASVALVCYALLPTVRATVSGLDGVPVAPLLAAAGLGMRRQQIFLQLQVPMAAPALLAGVRVVTVQAVGLAVVAALIGAGGFGDFVFQGLGQYALDLVLLGALPATALALAADAALTLAADIAASRTA